MAYPYDNNPYVPQSYTGTPVQQPSGTAPYYRTYPYQANNPNYAQQYQAPMNYGMSNAVNNKNIIWVAGQAGAEAYQMEPGSRAVLLDSKDQIFYIKVVGPDGRPEPLMAFKYEPLNLNIQNQSSEAVAQDMSNYVTKSDFDQLKQMIEDLTKPGGKNG